MTDHTEPQTDAADRDLVCPKCGHEKLLEGQQVYNGPRLLPRVTEDRECDCERDTETNQ